MDQTTQFCPVCHRQSLFARPSTNHIFHLLMTVFLCGWWLPIWGLSFFKFGGWRCQSCGYSGSMITKIVVPLVLVCLMGVPAVLLGVSLMAGLAAVASRVPQPVATSPTVAASPLPPPIQLDEPTKAESEIESAKEEAKPVPGPIFPEPALPEPPPPTEEEIRRSRSREWATVDGKFSVVAEFVTLIGDKVKLRRADDGREITVPLERLSSADRAWIDERRQ